MATDLAVLAGCCWFFFFFGLAAIGLVGADEPRYAQIAREMLTRHDWVTPVLYGKPWLEKPVLYYWEAMLSYRLFGVSDWSARLPAAVNATAMVAAVYFFVRRFFASPEGRQRRGIELDAALITASCAFLIAFGRAASTDMPLTAAFTIAMLCWMSWQMTGRKAWLAPFYGLLALGTLAKGPIAPFLAALVIVVFAVLRRNLGILRRTLWLPGVVIYFLVAAPWYVLVQLRTGNFFRVFILEHNLERYGTTVFHHPQPFWYFGPIILAAVLPWTAPAIAGFFHDLGTGAKGVPRELATGAERAGLSLFLVLWSALPVLFFSFSGAKLPGYILPAVPPLALLAAGYVQCTTATASRPNRFLALLHALISGATLAAALLGPYLLMRLHPPRQAITIAVLAGASGFAVVAITLHRLGISPHHAKGRRGRDPMRAIRFITLLPVILGMAFLLRVAAPVIDAAISSQPVARVLARQAPPDTTVAVLAAPRELEYGLAFYRNQPVARYERGEIPASAHLLVTGQTDPARLESYLGDRNAVPLGTFASQRLEFYWISGKVH